MNQRREDRLTVMITTYNRLSRLYDVISSLNKNAHHGEYDVLIVDNCSPGYNSDDIVSQFDEDLKPFVTVERRAFNCGMSCNISSCFLLVKTKWCLFLSDDDWFIEDALNIVFKDMECNNDCCAIKYTLEGFAKHSNIRIYDIIEYIDYFTSYKNTGDAIYLTMLYNLEQLNDSMIFNTSYGYSFIGFLFPVWNVLIKNQAPLLLSSNSIIRYKEAEKGTHWGYLKVVLGLCTLYDVPFDLSFKEKRRLFRTVLVNFSMEEIINSLFEKNKEERLFYGKKIYYSLLWPIYGYRAILRFSLPFYLRRVLNIDLYNIYHKLKH